MFPVPPAWTHETGLPLEAGILELWDTIVPIISRTCTDAVCSSLPPSWAREDSIIPKVLHKHLLFRRRATWVGVWVEVGDRAHKPRLQGPKACLRRCTID